MRRPPGLRRRSSAPRRVRSPRRASGRGRRGRRRRPPPASRRRRRGWPVGPGRRRPAAGMAAPTGGPPGPPKGATSSLAVGDRPRSTGAPRTATIPHMTARVPAVVAGRPDAPFRPGRGRSRSGRHSRSAAASAASSVGGLHHDPDQGLGPARAQQDPAAVAQFGLHRVRPRSHTGAGPRPGRRGRPPPRCAAPGAGAPWPRPPGRPAAPARRTIRSAAAGPDSTPSPVVARSRKTRWPDCSPPSDQPCGVEGLEHVAVADRGCVDGDAGGRHGPVEAEVGHHRDHHGVAGQAAPLAQVGGEQGQQPVAVDDVAVAVDGDDPVGVAVEGQAQRRPVPATTAAARRRGIGRAAAVVDVGAVGRRRRGRPRPRHRPRSGSRRR